MVYEKLPCHIIPYRYYLCNKIHKRACHLCNRIIRYANVHSYFKNNYVYRYSVYIHIHMFIDAFAKVSYILYIHMSNNYIFRKKLLKVSFVWGIKKR